MLYVFGFQRLGVVLSDLYVKDPDPLPGQEGAERGVRLELRLLELTENDGTIYDSRAIVVGRPIWRADLLESVVNPGSLDRAHHHPSMRGWDPGARRFEPELTGDPVEWVINRLQTAEMLLDPTQFDDNAVPPEDFDELRSAVPEIADAIRLLLDRIQSGQLATAPADEKDAKSIRIGWL
jgi:hypothetical protein